jgi:hypothetical protein
MCAVPQRTSHPKVRRTPNGRNIADFQLPIDDWKMVASDSLPAYWVNLIGRETANRQLEIGKL